ncbi:hypothetical protein M0811_06215 [Anaeramoeba ignava]|uniref:Uncharacterized protein n=1 Tax=Anaeramoeba ignava TaxID=1746090 RepID=A0A9Q0LRK5_ANAIG|nr:hypothetical protein M0811_06215 [Anaeramoeba ignava]
MKNDSESNFGMRNLQKKKKIYFWIPMIGRFGGLAKLLRDYINLINNNNNNIFSKNEAFQAWLLLKFETINLEGSQVSATRFGTEAIMFDILLYLHEDPDPETLCKDFDNQLKIEKGESNLKSNHDLKTNFDRSQNTNKEKEILPRFYASNQTIIFLLDNNGWEHLNKENSPSITISFFLKLSDKDLTTFLDKNQVSHLPPLECGLDTTYSHWNNDSDHALLSVIELYLQSSI